jgi:tRNA nucleotidyltransferase/poly(A) polymerase
MTHREFAVQVVRVLRDAGHQALFAGGCVRDALLAHAPDDYDVATSAHPDQIQALFPRTLAIGAAFGVVEVLGPKPIKVQVATFRSDGPYTDGRRPDTVAFSDARADAERRDFTLNGLFFDPLEAVLYDYVGGEADLNAHLLRAIGEPEARFREDRLRLLRGVRFAARFDLAIEPTTWAALKAMASQVITVSGERIAEELRKLLPHPNRARGISLLHESGLLAAILPEVDSCHLEALARLDRPSFPLAFAVLLEQVPVRRVGPIAERLRLSNTERDRIQWLIDHKHALREAERLPLHAVKPLLSHDGRDELLAMHRAFGDEAGPAWCAARMAEWPAERIDPPPLLTGDDLKAMGLTPGPQFRELLDRVRREQLDERIATREAAVALIGEGVRNCL